MPFNIIESVEARLTPDVLTKVAESNAETPAKTRAAMSSGVLAMAAAVVHRGSNAKGAASLLSALQSPRGTRTGAASTLLGSGADNLTDAVARSSGVTKSAATNVMSMLAPIVMGVLGREVVNRRLDAVGLSNLLQSQKHHLTGLPGAFGTLPGSAEDVGAMRGTAKAAKDVHIYDAQRGTAPASRRRQRTWLPLLAVLALAALLVGLILLVHARTPAVPAIGTGEQEITTVPGPVVSAPERPSANEPTLDQPGQTSLTGAELGKPSDELFGEHLAGSGPLPDRFALPGVTFEFGSIAMTEGGTSTMDRLATALKEHPSARVRLEGHTDSVGGADVNRPLSYGRAAAAKKMLVDRGIDASRIEVSGRREIDPVAPTDTKDGRAQNRRLDAVVIQR